VFTCWGQFTAMLFCQFAHANSLRKICHVLFYIDLSKRKRSYLFGQTKAPV
jgi:hypothetical protein